MFKKSSVTFKFNKTALLMLLCASTMSWTACDPDEPENKGLDPEQGAQCDPDTFVNKCAKDTDAILLICEQGMVASKLCTGSCANMDGVGQCASPKCNANEVQKDCSGSAYAATQACSIVDDDGFYHYAAPEEKFCPGGCSNETHECLKRTEHEDESCDATTFEAYCENNYSVICLDGKVTVNPCEGNLTCQLLDATITVKDGTPSPYGINNLLPFCVENNETCNEVGETTTCKDVSLGNIRLYSSEETSYCLPNKDKTANYKVIDTSKTVMCEQGCSEDKKSCKHVDQPEDVDQPCDIQTFDSRCDNGYAVICIDKKVKAIYCNTDVCAVLDISQLQHEESGNVNHMAMCTSSVFECKSPDQTSFCATVDAFDGVQFSATYAKGQCIKTVDGDKSYFTAADDSESTPCNFGCNEDKTACAEIINQ